jgi:hypothetical protein
MAISLVSAEIIAAAELGPHIDLDHLALPRRGPRFGKSQQ